MEGAIGVAEEELIASEGRGEEGGDEGVGGVECQGRLRSTAGLHSYDLQPALRGEGEEGVGVVGGPLRVDDSGGVEGGQSASLIACADPTELADVVHEPPLPPHQQQPLIAH